MEVASALATPIWECCAKKITYFFTLPENLDAMEKSMNRLKRIRGDVMERINREESNPAEPVKRTHDVSGWLQTVEASEQEVGKILEENEDLKIGGNNCCCWSPNTCWRAYKLNNLVSQNLSNVRMEGMDSIFDEVLNLLVRDSSVGVIGLYGMGGVGKTTLLKKISNAFAKGNRDFESVMWVEVPKDQNLKDIQNQIGDILGLSWEDKKGTEKRSLDIHQVLKNKRFLLCLDDVWERVDLQRVGIPKIDIQEEEITNSKVVFTTRSENVCGLMDADRRIKVDCLRWQEALESIPRKSQARCAKLSSRCV
ncbi:hypothetical protein MKW92_028256 [Papaver armeniacum]|nr:hypothetical protein MKW92_028256 [Papaver armeniacum]